MTQKINVLVPTFDEFDNYNFIKYETVVINKPATFEDINAITKHLPGIPCGGVGREPLKDLFDTGKREVLAFYDRRQGRRKTRSILKNFYVKIQP